MKLKLFTPIAFILGLWANTSQAEYLMIVGQADAPPSNAKTLISNNASKGPTLSEFLKNTVPSDWKTLGSPDINGDMAIDQPSLNGGWQERISQLASNHNLKVTANYDSKTLLIEAGAGGIKYKASEKAAPTTWTLNPSLLLSENLSEWAKLVGWEISWGLGDDDFTVDSETTFQGDIGTALRSVAEVYKNSERPFTVTAHSNSVFRIDPLSN